MNKNKEQLIDDSELRLPDNDERKIRPEYVRLMVQDLIDSMPVFKTGGLLFEFEVGYKDSYRPSSAGAFATVDMLTSVNREVDDAPTITLLVDDSNWTDNIYTGTAITIYNPGDFYITETHDYKFFTLSGNVTVRRIPFKHL